MLVIENVSMDYDEAPNVVHALKNINLSLNKNELTIIEGPSGSGKTTLLNILGCLLKPTAGRVLVDDCNIIDLNDNAKADYRNKTIGYVFQSFYLEPNFSVYDNVEVPLIIAGISKKERKEMIEKTLENVGLIDKENIITSKLSGGEKQRVAIARAIVNNPKIILADEPTENLDSKNGDMIMQLLKKISKENKIVIVITHNNEQALKYGDKIYNLSDGEINEK